MKKSELLRALQNEIQKYNLRSKGLVINRNQQCLSLNAEVRIVVETVDEAVQGRYGRPEPPAETAKGLEGSFVFLFVSGQRSLRRDPTCFRRPQPANDVD